MKKQNLTQKAYLKIKSQILTGNFHPGVGLSEPKLVSMLKIGRSPVREAVQRLRHEGFVKVVPQKGIFLTAFLASEIQQIYEMAEALEGMAAKLATERASQDEIHKLEIVVDKMKTALAEHNKKAWIEADSEFHRLVLKFARNKYISEAMATVNDRIHRVRQVYLQVVEWPIESTKEHEKAAQMIADRKPELAKKVTEQHLQRVRAHHVRIFKEIKAI